MQLNGGALLVATAAAAALAVGPGRGGLGAASAGASAAALLPAEAVSGWQLLGGCCPSGSAATCPWPCCCPTSQHYTQRYNLRRRLPAPLAPADLLKLALAGQGLANTLLFVYYLRSITPLLWPIEMLINGAMLALPALDLSARGNMRVGGLCAAKCSIGSETPACFGAWQLRWSCCRAGRPQPTGQRAQTVRLHSAMPCYAGNIRSACCHCCPCCRAAAAGPCRRAAAAPKGARQLAGGAARLDACRQLPAPGAALPRCRLLPLLCSKGGQALMPTVLR